MNLPAAASPAILPPYMSGLNPAQQEAVEAIDGPVLVLAGAGTGKTRVLTTRLVHMLTTGRAHPGQILAVTFTNKAAREMKERIGQMLGRPVEGWWLGTFHALAARILRRHAELVGLTPSFTILDDDDQLRLIKQLLAVHGIDDKKWPARLLLSVISRWKDKALRPDKITYAEAGDIAGGKLVEIYGDYQERLRTLNAADFGDLLMHNITIFQDHAHVLAHYHNQFRYLMVDEYQDANVAQYLWLRLLAQAHKNICVVGDDDQSIYGWRGAEVENILRFDRDFPEAKVVRLEQNYRSTSHILAAASGVIANNADRLGKTLWTDADGGEKVKVKSLWDAEEEARWVADEIESLQRRGTSLSDTAILVRAGFQTREFEERFLQLGIPYRVYGGLRFYERAEIRDALAYMRFVHSLNDDLAFERIVNTPKRGIGDSSVQTLHTLARAQKISIGEAALRIVESDELRPKTRGALRELMLNFTRWRRELETQHHTEVAQIILEESGYIGMLQADKSPDAAGRLENLKEFVSAMGEFDTITAFLEHVSLVMDNMQDSNADQVTMMTLHSAKGLEFKNVFLPGWEEGLFPSQKSMDEKGTAGLEEERRLAYVGITRARERAMISHAARRRIFGNWQNSLPSRFVGELPKENIEAETTLSISGYAPTLGIPPQLSYLQRPARDFSDYEPGVETEDGIFTRGSRVFHQKFGMGTVTGIDHDKLDIQFDHAGKKRVMASFVGLAAGR